MYREGITTYYKSHPEHAEIPKNKDSSSQITRPVQRNISETECEKCGLSCNEMKIIICNIESNITLALLNLKRSSSYLRYI